MYVFICYNEPLRVIITEQRKVIFVSCAQSILKKGILHSACRKFKCHIRIDGSQKT